MANWPGRPLFCHSEELLDMASDRNDALFQMLILRECHAQPTLRSQIRLAETIERIGKILATPAAIALDNLARYTTGGSLPSELTRDMIIRVTGKENVLGCARFLLGQVAKASSAEEAYRICWESALCYGLIGWHDNAYRALEGSYHFDPRWKRHHHALGLVRGMESDFDRAIDHMNIVYVHEPQVEIRNRVGEGLSIAHVLSRRPEEPTARRAPRY